MAMMLRCNVPWVLSVEVADDLLYKRTVAVLPREAVQCPRGCLARSVLCPSR